MGCDFRFNSSLVKISSIFSKSVILGQSEPLLVYETDKKLAVSES